MGIFNDNQKIEKIPTEQNEGKSDRIKAEFKINEEKKQHEDLINLVNSKKIGKEEIELFDKFIKDPALKGLIFMISMKSQELYEDIYLEIVSAIREKEDFINLAKDGEEKELRENEVRQELADYIKKLNISDSPGNNQIESKIKKAA